MTNAFLANLIPESNRLDVPFASGPSATRLLQEAYSQESGFIGVFMDREDQPSWARRAARYLRDEFLHDTPGRIKLFGDVLPSLADDGAGKCLANFRHALDAWVAAGKPLPAPFTCQQDYGSCVDASCAEHECCLFGWRSVQPTLNEEYRHPSSWYKYAIRGYCSDGWDGSGIATAARRVGCAFRIKYDIGGNTVDFTDDDKNEQIVARTWCRSGIPKWLSDHTQTNHAYADGAITAFEGGIKELRMVFAAGGVTHTSGTRTSGGSKPFTIGSVGPHMQSAIGCDDSDDFRKFCKDVIGITPRTSDFPVIMNQTWGPGWSGECADKYWPSWWGLKPEGAWVWWASDVINRLSCDYVWLPMAKGFPRNTPPPPPSGDQPVIGGELTAEQVGAIIAIRGQLVLPACKTNQSYNYIVIPTQPGAATFKVIAREL